MLTFGIPHVTAYGLCTVIGLALAVGVILLLAWKRSFEWMELLWVSLSAAVGALLGAHILYFITKIPEFAASLQVFGGLVLGVLFVRIYQASSGLVYYGGFFGAILAIVTCCHVRKISGRNYLNLLVVGFPLFHCVGRIGCTLTGCCYGIEYHGIFAITYPASMVVKGVNDNLADFPRFPVQLLEALAELLIFILLLVIYIRVHPSEKVRINKMDDTKAPDGFYEAGGNLQKSNADTSGVCYERIEKTETVMGGIPHTDDAMNVAEMSYNACDDIRHNKEDSKEKFFESETADMPKTADTYMPDITDIPDIEDVINNVEDGIQSVNIRKDRISLVPIYMIVYGVVRFLDEFLRADEIRGIWGPFSTSQWIAMAAVAGAVIYIIAASMTRKQRI